MSVRIIGIKDHPEYLEQAIQYFSQRWSIDERIYRDCMVNGLRESTQLPRFYLMMEEDRIIGGFGIIMNDFVSRQDLFPYFCALYVEEDKRGQHLGAMLLEHARKEVNQLGFDKLYLCTTLVGYYEKYDWRFIGEAYHPWNEMTRIYEADTLNG